jgi:hypothetical protein
MWQVVEDGSECSVRMCWRTVNGGLVLMGTMIRDVHGLSQLNKQLLMQRGAVGEPFGLHEVGKKVASMVSAVSALNLTPSGIVPGAVSSASPSLKHSEEQEEEEIDL